MKLIVESDRPSCGRRAAEAGALLIREAMADRGEVNIIVATGASQLDMLESLTRQPGIRWDRINVFHLDEYVGLEINHPASFRGYLWQRFHSRLPYPPRSFHYLDGEADPQGEAQRIGHIIQQHPIDVAFVGIGENGHLAFNDPPADFDTEAPYLLVDLDEACRCQQYGEGWFPVLDDVPKQAISMSINQIMKSSAIICTVPDERKAEAVKKCVEGPVTNEAPASILQQHDRCTLFIDLPAASLLDRAHA